MIVIIGEDYCKPDASLNKQTSVIGSFGRDSWTGCGVHGHTDSDDTDIATPRLCVQLQ